MTPGGLDDGPMGSSLNHGAAFPGPFRSEALRG
jgi:hypothetical protein